MKNTTLILNLAKSPAAIADVRVAASAKGLTSKQISTTISSLVKSGKLTRVDEVLTAVAETPAVETKPKRVKADPVEFDKNGRAMVVLPRMGEKELISYVQDDLGCEHLDSAKILEIVMKARTRSGVRYKIRMAGELDVRDTLVNGD